MKKKEKEKQKKNAGDIKCTKNDNHMRHSSWNMEWDIIFCHFWPFFAFIPQKNQNFKTMKKASWDVITLHMYTKNHNMMYSSWDMEYNRPNFLSFWAIFCSFTPLLTPKLKILDLKKSWRYYPITHVYHKWRWYDVWFLKCKARQTVFLSFWVIFCSLTFLTTWKIKILKK